MMSEGLIDAGEAKREVEEYKYPKGKITSENRLTQSGAFENTYNTVSSRRSAGACRETNSTLSPRSYPPSLSPRFWRLSTP